MGITSLSADGAASGVNPAPIVPGLQVPGAPLASQNPYGIDQSCHKMWSIVEACQEKHEESRLRVNRDCLCDRDIISSWITCHKCWDRVTYHSNGKRDLPSSTYLIDEVTLSLVQSLCDRTTLASVAPDGDDFDVEVSADEDDLDVKVSLDWDLFEEDTNKKECNEDSDDEESDDEESDEEESDDDDSDEEEFDEEESVEVEFKDEDFDDEEFKELDPIEGSDEKDINKEESEEDDSEDDDNEEDANEEKIDEDVNEEESDEDQLSAAIGADGVFGSHDCVTQGKQPMSENFDLASDNSIGASLSHSKDEALIMNAVGKQLGGFTKTGKTPGARIAHGHESKAKSNANTRVASVGLVILGLFAAWAL
ncbi:unnamed protein product [Clonostachys solani]|uniref:Uncharacterized protein n=1 Tax=Clonostachys solani TaxID=160281 RepID=A0A9P0EMS5_9HYPO|nr:unnamed protein product [Clonostachys solani]